MLGFGLRAGMAARPFNAAAVLLVGSLTLLNVAPTRWPGVPSKTRSANFPPAGNDSGTEPPPTVMRAVVWMFDDEYPTGGTKKSLLLVAEPASVATLTCPDEAT